MRNTFYEYYGLNSSELDRIWKEGIFVFDTNVLLSLYRRPIDVREDILHAIRSFKNRIWIPHQVGFEFHEHRLEEANRPIDSLRGLSEKFIKFETDIQEEYEKNPYLDYKKIKSSLKRIRTGIEKNSKVWLEACPNYIEEDVILNDISLLFDGKVGASFDNTRLEEIFKEGEVRYSRKIPPGFKDDKKHEGDRHRFGDLIIWFQIIKKAKDSKQDIIFVTDDEKDDWWQIYKGGKIGPRKELIREFRENTDGHFIWFYTTDRFLINAKSREGVSIKSKTIEETRHLSQLLSAIVEQESQPGQFSMDSVLAHPIGSLDGSDDYLITSLLSTGARSAFSRSRSFKEGMLDVPASVGKTMFNPALRGRFKDPPAIDGKTVLSTSAETKTEMETETETETEEKIDNQTENNGL